jgi:hypothetical protein
MADGESRWLVGILSYPIVPPNPVTLSWLASEMERSKRRVRVPGPLFAYPNGDSYAFGECAPPRDSFLVSEKREAAKLAAQGLCIPGLDTSLDRVFEVEVSGEAFNLFDRSKLSGATPAMLVMLDALRVASESEGSRNMELLREIMERKARHAELISNVSKARTAVRKARRVVCRRSKKWNKLVTVPDADERNRVERLGEAITRLSDAVEALEAAERSLRDAVARARADGLPA